MLKGIDLREKVKFICKSDTGETPTEFYIGNISNRDKLRLFVDAQTFDGKVDTVKLQGKSFDILKAGLKEIKNLDGKDYALINDDVIDVIPFNAVMEVVGAILQHNFQSEQEVKN